MSESSFDGDDGDDNGNGDSDGDGDDNDNGNGNGDDDGGFERSHFFKITLATRWPENVAGDKLLKGLLGFLCLLATRTGSILVTVTLLANYVFPDFLIYVRSIRFAWKCLTNLSLLLIVL